MEIHTFSGTEQRINEDGIRFQLTEELARRVSRFRAAPYPSMVGYITVIGGADAEEGQEQNEQEEDSEI